MPLHEPEVDELGLWKPRSGYFQHFYKKARAKVMVQQAPQEHGARLAFCAYCQSAYLASDAVPNSPCHDTEPQLVYDLEQLFDSVNLLAELLRDRVAGATEEPSQEPSTASGAHTPESEQAGSRFQSGASVEDSNGTGAAERAPDEPDGSAAPRASAPGTAADRPARRRSRAKAGAAA